MKRIICILMAMILVFMVSACGATMDNAETQNTDEAGTSQPETDTAVTQTQQPAEESTALETQIPMDDISDEDTSYVPGYSLDEVIKKTSESYGQKIYIKHGDRFYSPSSDYTRVRDDVGGGAYNCLCSTDSIDTIPMLNLAQGDVLVTFEDEEYYNLYPAWEEGYCCPVDFNYYDNALVGPYGDFMPTHFVVPHLMKGKGYNYVDYTMINGQEFDSYDAASALAGQSGAHLENYSMTHCLICSDQISTVELSGYEGTQYYKYNFKTDAHRITISHEKYSESLPVEKTQNGYFVIDTSLLETGMYMIGSNSCLIRVQK